MYKDIIFKRIDVLRDSKNNLWTASLVSLSGTLTLMFNLDSKLKILFFCLGSLFSAIFVYGYFKKDDQIEYLISKLNKEN